MPNSRTMPIWIMLAMLAVAAPARAQSAGTDVTPDAPAAVEIMPAPSSPMISVAPPSLPDVIDATSGAGWASSGLSVGSTVNATGAVSAPNVTVSGNPSANTILDPYCSIAADPEASAMGLDATACNP